MVFYNLSEQLCSEVYFLCYNIGFIFCRSELEADFWIYLAFFYNCSFEKFNVLTFLRPIDTYEQWLKSYSLSKVLFVYLSVELSVNPFYF